MPRIAATRLRRQPAIGNRLRRRVANGKSKRARAQPDVNHRLRRQLAITIQRPPRGRTRRMWVIVLEIVAALALLLFIVWWTMFAGRRRGERRDDRDP